MSRSIYDADDSAVADPRGQIAGIHGQRAGIQDEAYPSTKHTQGQGPGNAARRFGQVLGIKPEHIEEYECLHRAVWPEVLATIHACNIRNYSIFRYENLLFAYFEYVGDDYAADMAKMAADPKTQEWWSICEPLQEPVPQHVPSEWWMTIREVFHVD